MMFFILDNILLTRFKRLNLLVLIKLKGNYYLKRHSCKIYCYSQYLINYDNSFVLFTEFDPKCFKHRVIFTDSLHRICLGLGVLQMLF